MKFTVRPSWPDKSDDFEFLVDGRAAGRCYKHIRGGLLKRGDGWHWTVYGTNRDGDEDTIEQAQAAFKAAYIETANTAKSTE
jgi:hypothetical protein